MAPRKKPGTAIVPVDVGPRVGQDDEATSEAFEARVALEERWHTAWRMKQIGGTYRQIAQQMRIDVHTAHDYVRKHQAKWGTSPLWEEERTRQLAVLSELEQKVTREAQDGTVTWTAASLQVMRVLDGIQKLMEPTRPTSTNSGGYLGQQPDAGTPVELPGAVAGTLTRLSIVA